MGAASLGVLADSTPSPLVRQVLVNRSFAREEGLAVLADSESESGTDRKSGPLALTARRMDSDSSVPNHVTATLLTFSPKAIT